MGKKLSFKGEPHETYIAPPLCNMSFFKKKIHYLFTIRTSVFKVSIVELLSIISQVILTIK